ncbi:unnamed protein product, partial [Protopolystoma xenopodis]
FCGLWTSPIALCPIVFAPIQIVQLFSADLLRDQIRWKDTLAELRFALADLSSRYGYPASHMAPWRAHLDRQLYKALEAQFRLGLESLSEQMSELQVVAVYQQGRLGFRPPLEEVSRRFCMGQWFIFLLDIIINSMLPH